MSDYLKRLHITDVEDTGENVGAYMKRVHIVEVVDSDGNPWEPVPGPDPWDELVRATNVEYTPGNIYAGGNTIGATTATFTGGSDQVIYRSRWQKRPTADDGWNNTSFQTHDNEATELVYGIPTSEAGWQIRLQTQARDEADDPVTQVQGNGSIKNIEKREFGTFTVTVNDIEYDYNTAPALTILVNDPIPLVVTHTGNATPTYTWSARNDYPLMIGSQAASTVLTFPQEGPVTVTCTIADAGAEGSPTSVIINFFVVDA